MNEAVVARLREAGCVYAEEEARLLLANFRNVAQLEPAVQRRETGEPLEHVLGYAVFCDLRIAVHRPVFIPRRRAEGLAKAAVDEVRSSRRGDTWFLDLGCGSGAIAATVVSATESSKVWASDVSAEAVACARLNAARYGYTVVLSDWWTQLPRELAGSLDVVAAYLPHVPDARVHDVPTDYRRAEEERAWRGGNDGLSALRSVLPGLGNWLAPTGVFMTLLAREQVAQAAASAREQGWAVTSREVDDENSSLLCLRN
ncbi:MAG: methyltransferase domain-containing protein [Nocardioidaceae bacterium]